MARYNLDSFMRSNTIQPSYLFSVEFTASSFSDNVINLNNYSVNYDFMTEMDLNLNIKVPEYKVKNVILPRYIFKREKSSHANIDYNFPVMETDGIELKIEIIENSEANLSKLIDYFVKRIINDYGFYNFPKDAQFEVITVTAYTQAGTVSMRHIFKECFFQSCTEFAYDYTVNDQVSSLITFVCNYYETEYPDKVISNNPQENPTGELPYYNPYGGN